MQLIPKLTIGYLCRDIHWQIMQNTMIQHGKFVKNSALLVNNKVNGESYVEYYELRLPKGGCIFKYDFKELYKICCAHLGYEHQGYQDFLFRLSFFIFSCAFNQVSPHLYLTTICIICITHK